MRPLLILQLRENDEAANGEFEAFLRYGDLAREEVVRVRMESDSLPDIDLSQYSGVLVGGGPWNVSDAPEKKDLRQQEAEAWLSSLLTQIVEQDFPYLGACYGLGILNKQQGAVVSKDHFTEDAGAIDVELTSEGLMDPLLGGLPQTFRAIVGHKEACQTLPQGACLIARSSACPIQMYRLGKNVYATQFHPELDSEGVCVRIDVYKHAGYFKPEEAEPLKEQLRKEHITIPMEILKRFINQQKTAFT